MIETISNKLTNTIKANIDGMSDEKCEVINYGLSIFIADVLKITIMLTIAYALGIFKYAVIALISSGILRSFAGGVHAKTRIGCLLAVCLITYGTVYASFLLNPVNSFILDTVLFLICFVILYLYAPSDHENKPVVSKKQRRMLRTLSFILLTVMYILSVSLLKKPISSIVMLAAFSEVLAILPITYRLTGNNYGSKARTTGCTAEEG